MTKMLSCNLHQKEKRSTESSLGFFSIDLAHHWFEGQWLLSFKVETLTISTKNGPSASCPGFTSQAGQLSISPCTSRTSLKENDQNIVSRVKRPWKGGKLSSQPEIMYVSFNLFQRQIHHSQSIWPESSWHCPQSTLKTLLSEKCSSRLPRESSPDSPNTTLPGTGLLTGSSPAVALEDFSSQSPCTAANLVATTSGLTAFPYSSSSKYTKVASEDEITHWVIAPGTEDNDYYNVLLGL